MIKSLLLAVACAYANPPGLQANGAAVQLHVDLPKALGMDDEARTRLITTWHLNGLQGAEAAAANETAGRPFWQLAPEHVAAGDLCSKLAAEPAATSEALNAFIDPTATWHRQPTEAYAMEPEQPASMDPRSGSQGRKFGLPGSDADYRKYQ